MALFANPQCEAALDQSCCAQQQQCMNDPGCRKIAECWQYCTMNQATVGKGCKNNCAPRGHQTPGVVNFEYVASCSKRVRYPPQVQCSG